MRRSFPQLSGCPLFAAVAAVVVPLSLLPSTADATEANAVTATVEAPRVSRPAARALAQARYADWVGFRGPTVPPGAIRVANMEDGTWSFATSRTKLAAGHVKIPSSATALSGSGPWPTGRLHVKLRAPADVSAASSQVRGASLAADLKVRFVRPTGVPNWVLLDVGASLAAHDSLVSVLQRLRSDPRVERAEASMMRRLDVRDFGDNALFPLQWHLENTGQNTGFPRDAVDGADVKAVQAWGRTFGSSDVVIAVLDSGQDDSHPDFPPESIRAPFDALSRTVGSAAPELGDIEAAHGIACAGLAAAPRGGSTGVVGVCPDCPVMPIRIFGTEAFGDDTSISDAFVHLRENNAAVASNSWGFGAIETPPQILRDAMVAFTELGRGGLGGVILFAIGNTYEEAVEYEISLDPNVLAVGGTGFDDSRVAYSTFHQKIDVVAPTGHDFDENAGTYEGAGLITTDRPGDDGYNPALDQAIAAGQVNDNDYTAIMSGTSGACPNAAGVVGLILAHEPQLSYAQVFRLLADSAEKVGDVPYNPIGHNSQYGFGRVDANFALDLIDSQQLCVPAPEVCNDGVDNDCDLSIDTDDRDCGFTAPLPEVPHGLPCFDDSVCGDGFCVPLDSGQGGGVCSSTCFGAACSEGGRCVTFGDGANEVPLCLQDCAEQNCRTGTSCADTADGPVCLPPCSFDSFCPAGLSCLSPGDVCGGNGEPEPEPVPEPEPDGVEPTPLEPAAEPSFEPDGVEPDVNEPGGAQPRRIPGRIRIASVSNCSQTGPDHAALLLGLVLLLGGVRRRRRMRLS